VCPPSEIHPALIINKYEGEKTPEVPRKVSLDVSEVLKRCSPQTPTGRWKIKLLKFV
jgi:hypothetical protein